MVDEEIAIPRARRDSIALKMLWWEGKEKQSGTKLVSRSQSELSTITEMSSTTSEKPLLDRLLRVKRANQLKRYGVGEVERKEAEAAR